MFTDYDLRIMQLEEQVKELQIEIAGKNEVITALHDDIRYYRKDLKDQITQDHGLEQ